MDVEQRNLLVDGLVEAFDRQSLRLLLFRIGQQLDDLSGGGRYKTVVVDVVEIAVNEQWVTELVDQACKERPLNKMLNALRTNTAATTAPSAPDNHAGKTILFLAAEPSDLMRLQLGKERQYIHNQIGDVMTFKEQWAVTVPDLTAALLDTRPHIIHFSGHSESGELYLEDPMGKTHVVSAEALSRLFGISVIKETVQCIVLNACYSTIQADALKAHIPYVVGMSNRIKDNVARTFSVGFYQAIARNLPIPIAFELAVAQIDLQGLSDSDIPQLHVKEASLS